MQSKMLVRVSLLLVTMVVLLAFPLTGLAIHKCTGNSVDDAATNVTEKHNCVGAIAKDIAGLVDVINKIVVALQTILFAVAALFIVIAAITYLTAGGEEEKIGKAKNMIIYAIIAIVLALLAFGIDDIVEKALPPRS